MGTRRVESFLLRLVVEDEPYSPDLWRGRIQHIATGQEQQIDEFEQAIAFITAHLGQFGPIRLSIEPETPTLESPPTQGE